MASSSAPLRPYPGAQARLEDTCLKQRRGQSTAPAGIDEQQARDSVKAAANGFHGQLRIALSDGITPSRLPALLALCRQEEPEVDIRLFQVPLSQQLKGLQDDLYDVGFAQSDEVSDGITAEAVWNDPLMVAVPARHHLLEQLAGV